MTRRSYAASALTRSSRAERASCALSARLPPAASTVSSTRRCWGAAAFAPIREGGARPVVRGWDDSPTERDIQIHQVAVRTVLERTDWLDELREMASDGRIALRVAAEYPPQPAAHAHRD